MLKKQINKQKSLVNKVTKHREYSSPAAIRWGIWMGYCLFAYFTHSMLHFAISFAVFGILEGYGIKKKGPDTWSELVWAFLVGGWSRAFLILGWCGWTSLWFLSMLDEFSNLYPYALVSLVSGLTLWLVTHFLFKGKQG